MYWSETPLVKKKKKDTLNSNYEINENFEITEVNTLDSYFEITEVDTLDSYFEMNKNFELEDDIETETLLHLWNSFIGQPKTYMAETISPFLNNILIDGEKDDINKRHDIFDKKSQIDELDVFDVVYIQKVNGYVGKVNSHLTKQVKMTRK
ncbi:hypothetical protein Glove_166g200 [Diversispora epigaea]|uniref:Uncharacterized protein n=1 Tax=Diversispora epigaea TaxID=1348612 RepID=A0A397IYT9_9GLOM|nr:hypothetical protein Glove_166g200 [Diversispora epigaea]